MPGDDALGDSKLSIQPLSSEILEDCKLLSTKMAQAFDITGPFNMQLILERGVTSSVAGKDYTLKVIECNLRASRSFPFVSKVLGVNFIDLATRALVGDPSLEPLVGDRDPMLETRPYKAVKVPVFSWTRLAGADPFLGVEMASTGEVACFGRDLKEAFFVAHASNHNNFKTLPIPQGSSVLVTLDEQSNKNEALYIMKKLEAQGYPVLLDSEESARGLGLSGAQVLVPGKSGQELSRILQDRKLAKSLLEDHQVSLVISLCRTKSKDRSNLGYLVRRNAVDFGLGLLNDSKGAIVFVDAMEDYVSGVKPVSESISSWDEFQKADGEEQQKHARLSAS
jgi:carbamoyl-phosphate synthase large subunit